MEKLTCACATDVICVSNGVKSSLIEEGICSPSKAKVIHYGSASGIDLSKFDILDKNVGNEIRKELGIPMSDFVFVFVGRLVTDKGVNELVSSFVKLHSLNNAVHLILIGAEDGKLNPIFSNTKGQILESSNIHSLGVKNDIRPYLQCANAFVLPSYREGFGMVLIEAGAMGLPCITTDVPGCNEIIIHGLNGEIIPARDEDALYAKMKEWLEDPEKVHSMAKNSRIFVESRYDRKIVWNALLEEYKRLVS
jgi:glycosyltransferase involved in cell wall biosynthesis